MRLLIAGLALACLHAAALSPTPALRQDAYVWQRVWTPAVSAALQQSNALIDGWRVLAAETGADGHLKATHPDWKELAQSSRAVTPVIRIDGQLATWDPTQITSDVASIVDDLRGEGISIAGVEIDYDCGTHSLPLYTRFLAALHARLGTLRISITALPAWLDSPDLDALLAEADEVVLQVHAVRNPHLGLFDAGLARTWAETLAARIRKPFRLALPTYSTRVSWGEDGGIAAVESEMPRLTQGATYSELTVPPRAVAAFVADIERDPPQHLSGLVWFRLPTRDDSRAWSLDTWQAVMQGRVPPEKLALAVRAGQEPGLKDLVLVNEGDMDAELPESLSLPADCSLADGVNGYSLDYGPPHLALHRDQQGLLHGHYELRVGWMRCENQKVALDVQQ